MRLELAPRRVISLPLPPSVLRRFTVGIASVVHVPLRQALGVGRGDAVWIREGFSVEDRRGGPRDLLDVTYVDGVRRRVRWPRAVAAPSPGYHAADRMPVQLSRLTLLIGEAKRIRLHEVSEDAAVAGGVMFAGRDGWSHPVLPDLVWPFAVEAYGRLWDLTHDGVDCWACNPEVVQLRVRTLARCICDVVPGMGHGGAR